MRASMKSLLYSRNGVLSKLEKEILYNSPSIENPFTHWPLVQVFSMLLQMTRRAYLYIDTIESNCTSRARGVDKTKPGQRYRCELLRYSSRHRCSSTRGTMFFLQMYILYIGSCCIL